jgi:hypothetical protein
VPSAGKNHDKIALKMISKFHREIAAPLFEMGLSAIVKEYLYQLQTFVLNYLCTGMPMRLHFY